MKTIAAIFLLTVAAAFGDEAIHWTDVWMPGCDKDDKPRVLLVGDSITKGYYDGVAKAFAGKAYVAKLATSFCVADPAYEPTLRALLVKKKFAVIHFNNGLHGFDYTEQEYKAGYQRALKLIRELQPQTKLILALTTPLKPGSNKENLNPRVDQRNKVVRQLTGKLPINDLHSLMKGHAEYYIDPYHYSPAAISIQAAAVTKRVSESL